MSARTEREADVPRKACAALKRDPAARLHIPLNAPGPREVLEGKNAPGSGVLRMEEDEGEELPALAAALAGRVSQMLAKEEGPAAACSPGGY